MGHLVGDGDSAEVRRSRARLWPHRAMVSAKGRDECGPSHPDGRGGFMTGAVLVRWGANIPGRESKGLEVFAKSIARFEQLAKQGRIHSHNEYIALTGDVGGFMIVEGEVEELQKKNVETEKPALFR